MVLHSDVVDAVIAALKLLPERGYRTSDIHYCDFPFDKKPPFGVIVSPLMEAEGDSLNETTDIAFPVQVMRVGHVSNSSEGFRARDRWRRDVWHRFNNVRLFAGANCELMTTARFSTIEIPDAWSSWKLDSSVLIVTTWIRELHQGGDKTP